MSLLLWMLAAACVFAAFIAYGQVKWRYFTGKMQEQLESHRRPIVPVTLDRRQRDDLSHPR